MTAAFLIIFCACAHAAEKVKRTIDLGKPGALEAIEIQNPGHHRRIVEIVRVAGEVSCETLPGVLHVRFEVAATWCSTAMILTSYPAKRHLWFQLDDTAYMANVTLGNSAGKLIPAK